MVYGDVSRYFLFLSILSVKHVMKTRVTFILIEGFKFYLNKTEFLINQVGLVTDQGIMTFRGPQTMR